MGRVAIIGSREYQQLKRVVEYVNSLPKGTVVISGHAKGVDQVAEKAARACGLEVVSIPAEWGKYGKSAGFRRNVEIVDRADVVVAFWDGESKGTEHTISVAKKRGVRVIVNPKYPPIPF